MPEDDQPQDDAGDSVPDSMPPSSERAPPARERPPTSRRQTNMIAVAREDFVPKPADLPRDVRAHMPIVRKLANEILPWFVSAEELRKKPLYRAHLAYSWTRDTLAGLTGFGLSHPLAKAINGESSDLGTALTKMPFWLYCMTGFAAVSWVVLKAFVTRDDGEKKAMLAASCRKEFMGLNLKLRSALQQPRPLKALVQIQAEVTGIVDRHIAEGSWAFANDDILAPKIHEKVRRRVADLVAQHLSSWDEPSRDGEVDRADNDDRRDV